MVTEKIKHKVNDLYTFLKALTFLKDLMFLKALMFLKDRHHLPEFHVQMHNQSGFFSIEPNGGYVQNMQG